jgi:hypothetical protein
MLSCGILIGMKTLLEQITPRMTTTINGHVVTRWSEAAYEVDTLGRTTVTLETALGMVSL